MVDKSNITDAAFKKATRLGTRELARGPLATAAKFQDGRIFIELNNGCLVAIPLNLIQGLETASEDQLLNIQIEAAGLGLHWPDVDADTYVPALIQATLQINQPNWSKR